MSNKLFQTPVFVEFKSGTAVFEKSHAEQMSMSFKEAAKEYEPVANVQYEIVLPELLLLIPFITSTGSGDELAQEIASLVQRRVVKRVGRRAVDFFN